MPTSLTLVVDGLLQDAHSELSLAHGLAREVVLAHKGLVSALCRHELALQTTCDTKSGIRTSVVVITAMKSSRTTQRNTELIHFN